MAKPLMAKATAVWLVDNTTLSFKQIADFCGLHELEVQGIADGDVATGVKGYDPIAHNQLDEIEIKKAEADPTHPLKLKYNPAAIGEEKRRGPRYTPLSKRQARPSIQAIRERTHWNIQNIQPIDPVALGLCRQSELDGEVQKAAKKKAAEGGVMNDDERRKLVSTEQSLDMAPEPRLPRNIAGLEGFTLSGSDTTAAGDDDDEDKSVDYSDAESFFNLPDDAKGDTQDDADADDAADEDDKTS